jgi:acyl carrier protein
MRFFELILGLFGISTKRKSKADFIKKKVVEILVDKMAVSEGEITPEADLVKDLGAYSLLITEIIMALEDAFKIKIPDEDVEKIVKVKDILDYLEKKVQ